MLVEKNGFIFWVEILLVFGFHTAMPYRARTGLLLLIRLLLTFSVIAQLTRGFFLCTNSQREKPVFIAGNPSSYCRDPVFISGNFPVVITGYGFAVKSKTSQKKITFFTVMVKFMHFLIFQICSGVLHQVHVELLQSLPTLIKEILHIHIY